MKGKFLAFVSCVFVFAGNAPLAAQPSMTVQRLASGLARPLFVTCAPGDPTRLFIVEQRSGSTGRIRIFNLTTGTLLATPFLSVNSVSTGNEQGLLGLAFHPDYQANGRFYVNFTSASQAGATVIREYQRSTPDLANANSGRDLLTIPQPFANHNGGWMAFSPIDNLMYISSGDGGSANDPGNNAQNKNSLLGKILRINPLGNNSSNGQYGNPASNPFFGATAGADEVWCYGLRNPWRCSFDFVTGDLYIADVGQNLLEEVNVQPGSSTGGQNYGWRVREGTSGAPLAGAIDPIYTYTRGPGSTQGFSVTGGYVYRGPVAALRGRYFFGDYVNDTVWSMNWNGSAQSSHNGTNYTDFINWTPLISAPSGTSVGDVASFGEDLSGNLYICDLGGEVFRVTDAEVPLLPEEGKLLDGTPGAGSLSDVYLRDNVRWRLNPGATSNPIKQKVVLATQAIARSASPARLVVRVEARMTGGPPGDVLQTIALVNQETGAYDVLDARAITNADGVVQAEVEGNTAPYVNPVTREVTVITSWTSEEFSGTPFTWFIEIDEHVLARAE